MMLSGAGVVFILNVELGFVEKRIKFGLPN